MDGKWMLMWDRSWLDKRGSALLFQGFESVSTAQRADDNI